MTIEYVVLGALIMVMGVIQIWLRHGPEGRKLRAEQDAVRERRLKEAEVARAEMEAEYEDATSGDEAAAAHERRKRFEADQKAFRRSNRLWTGWTAILGGVGIGLGIVLVILGILGY
jgi:hypothetical protein